MEADLVVDCPKQRADDAVNEGCDIAAGEHEQTNEFAGATTDSYGVRKRK